MSALIRVEQAFKQYGQIAALQDVNVSVQRGEFFGVIGPNGSGKSTLVQAMSGAEPLTSGSIHLDGKRVETYSRKSLAKWVAVLQQEALPSVRFTVREVVEMGRYPFQNWLGDEKIDHSALIDDIMAQLHLLPLADRYIGQLSGGERQRVALGKVMAQQPTLLLLDEPTTYLDIGYQMQMMDAVLSWQAASKLTESKLSESKLTESKQAASKLTVVAVLHDLNIAAQYCDRLMLMNEGRVVKIGTPEQVIESGLINKVYGTEPIILPHPVTQRPQILLTGGKQ